MLIAVAGAALLVAGLVDVDGDTRCPTAAAVAERLAGLLPAHRPPTARPFRAPDRAHLRSDGVVLRIDLAAADGAALAARALPVDAGACAEAAAEAAVVIASWERAPRAARPPDVAPPLRLRYEAEAALLVTLAPTAGGDVAAVGAQVSGALGSYRSGFGARLAIAATTTRDEPLGPGRAQYTRAWLAAGPRYRVARGRWEGEAHAEGVVALLSVSGAGFTASSSALDVDPGVGGGVRAAVRLGGVRLAIGAAVIGWLRRQVVTAENVFDPATLPRLDLCLTLGVGLASPWL